MPKTLTKKEVTQMIYGIGVDSCNRMSFIINLIHDDHYKLSDKTYWDAIHCAYVSSDNIYKQIPLEQLLAIFLNSNRKQREFIMTKKEQKYLNSLPEFVTIYRGMSLMESDSKVYGISWTLSEERAIFFTTDLRSADVNGIVVRLEVPKSDIIAYWSDRDEHEIIYIENSRFCHN